MNKALILAPALVLALISAPPVAASGATAASHVDASHAWIRLLPGDLPAGGYLTLSNTGDTDTALTGVSADVWSKVMLHRTTETNGTSHMNKVDELPLPAQQDTALEPGGYHLMFMHAQSDVSPGDTVPVTLQLDDGSTLEVEFTIRKASATGAPE